MKLAARIHDAKNSISLRGPVPVREELCPEILLVCSAPSLFEHAVRGPQRSLDDLSGLTAIELIDFPNSANASVVLDMGIVWEGWRLDEDNPGPAPRKASFNCQIKR